MVGSLELTAILLEMRPRVCICCGELMSERGGSLSRNPNICESCSSLADGADEAAKPAKVLPGASHDSEAAAEETAFEHHKFRRKAA